MTNRWTSSRINGAQEILNDRPFIFPSQNVLRGFYEKKFLFILITIIIGTRSLSTGKLWEAMLILLRTKLLIH